MAGPRAGVSHTRSLEPLPCSRAPAQFGNKINPKVSTGVVGEGDQKKRGPGGQKGEAVALPLLPPSLLPSSLCSSVTGGELRAPLGAIVSSPTQTPLTEAPQPPCVTMAQNTHPASVFPPAGWVWGGGTSSQPFPVTLPSLLLTFWGSPMACPISTNQQPAPLSTHKPGFSSKLGKSRILPSLCWA